MLAADKDRLIANVKQNALQLRQRELEYYVERYSNLATQASIIAGFAFDGLVELDPTVAGKTGRAGCSRRSRLLWASRAPESVVPSTAAPRWWARPSRHTQELAAH